MITKNVDDLGYIVFWTIHQGNVDLNTIYEALAQEGLPADLVKEPTARRAFGRSAKQFDKMRDHRFARKIADDKRRRVVGIVHETTDGVEHLDYSQATTAHFDKEDGTISVTGEDAEEFRAAFQKFSVVLTDQDVRDMVRTAISLVRGVALRETGGVYFIPHANIDTLVKVDNVLRSLKMGQITILRYGDGENERQAAWEAAREDVTSRIEAILTSVDKISAKASYLERHESRLQDIEEMVNAYSELTGIEEAAEDIQEKINDAQRKIQEKMAEIEGKKKQKVSPKQEAEEVLEEVPEEVLA